MHISVWGPATWTLLHAVSFALREDEHELEKTRDAVCALLRSLARLLPCRECREHFLKSIHEDPPERNLDSAEDMQRYVWALHNKVNRRCGKAEYSWESIVSEYRLGGSGVCPAPPEDDEKGGRKGGVLRKRRIASVIAADKPIFTAGCLVVSLFVAVVGLSCIVRYAQGRRWRRP